MTEPCMFPNLHEPFYCRIHADVRLRLTDERCRRGVTLTQPQPRPTGDTALRTFWRDEPRTWSLGYRRRLAGIIDAALSSPATPSALDVEAVKWLDDIIRSHLVAFGRWQEAHRSEADGSLTFHGPDGAFFEAMRSTRDRLADFRAAIKGDAS